MKLNLNIDNNFFVGLIVLSLACLVIYTIGLVIATYGNLTPDGIVATFFLGFCLILVLGILLFIVICLLALFYYAVIDIGIWFSNL